MSIEENVPPENVKVVSIPIKYSITKKIPINDNMAEAIKPLYRAPITVPLFDIFTK